MADRSVSRWQSQSHLGGNTEMPLEMFIRAVAPALDYSTAVSGFVAVESPHGWKDWLGDVICMI